MLTLREVLVVEGRYDRNTVSQVVDCTIVETSGFSIFSDREKIALLRRLAEKRGLIILTDSDGAGFFIRGRLKGMLDPGMVKHAYIPDIPGREKRKRTASKEGKLGVEGMRPEVILEALRRAGATFTEETAADGPARQRITKADLYELGLTGVADSARRREELCERLSIPKRISPNGLLDILNALYSKEEFLSIF